MARRPTSYGEGFEEGVFFAVKLYPAGATTHSEFAVTSVAKVAKALECMEELGMPLLVHGESTDPEVDVFDREAVFIEDTLVPMLKDFPGAEGSARARHHRAGRRLRRRRRQRPARRDGDAAAPDVQPRRHLHRWPASALLLPAGAQARASPLALRRLAVSGHPNVFLGTDSAPHLRRLKEAGCGCAGIFNAPSALQSYATVFEQENALHRFEAFASLNGARFYGLPPNEGTVTLRREPAELPEEVALPSGDAIHPFLGGSSLPWTLAEPIGA